MNGEDGTSENFNPRAPCGARPVSVRVKEAAGIFQSTRPVRGATLPEHDLAALVPISIHAPRAGRDPYTVNSAIMAIVFQSTRPVRGATAIVALLHDVCKAFQSTRPVRGATEAYLAPLAEEIKFQSTRPVRGATTEVYNDFIVIGISIHAPRAGRDSPLKPFQAVLSGYFNPRAPCGARQP